MKKKFLIFAVMIFIIALGAVSAQDIDDSALVSYESQNADRLSALGVDDVETADILQTDSNSQISALDENKSVEIIAYQNEGKLIASAVDNDGNYMHEGYFSFTSENGGSIHESLWNDYVSFNLYNFDMGGLTDDHYYYGPYDRSRYWDCHPGKNKMCLNLASESGACTITCPTAVQTELQSGTELVNSRITWHTH